MLLLVVLATASTPSLAAQADPLPEPGSVLELQISQRWLHERQRPEFTPFDLVRSGNAVDRERGRRNLSRLFREAEPSEDSLAAELMNRMIAIAVDGEDSWLTLRGSPDTARWAFSRIPGEREAAAPLFLLDRDLLPEVRRHWELRPDVTVTSVENWGARSARLPAILFKVGPVLRLGPLVRLRIDYETRFARAEDEAPGGYAGGFTLDLIEAEEGWRLVSTGAWIT